MLWVAPVCARCCRDLTPHFVIVLHGGIVRRMHALVAVFPPVRRHDSMRDGQKREAGEAAAALVKDGMVSRTRHRFHRLLRHRGIDSPGSRGIADRRDPHFRTQRRSGARRRHPLTDFTEHPRLDLTIDGADEIEIGTLNLIKGLGGALLREKIVAAASERLVIVADGQKLVERLGATAPVPVEVVPFGWETTVNRLRRLGTDPQLRRDAAGQFRTDGGNRILDCHSERSPTGRPR